MADLSVQSASGRSTGLPVFMSALMQAPLVEAAIGRDAKVLLLTANSKTLLAARTVLLREAGVKVDDPSKFVVQGVERLAGFEPLADPSLGTIDTEVACASLVDCVRSRIFADPSIACLLLECTELPPYEDALREATSLPVFSVVSLFSYFYGARQQSAFGRAEKEADVAAEQQKLLAQQALEAGELPPSREGNGDLRADAHRRVQISCERALASVRELVSETLADAAEADVNDVRGANVSGAVWGRLRLLERVRPMLAAQTKTDTVNEVPLAGLNIHVTDLFKHYLPLACSLHERYTAFRAAKLAAGDARHIEGLVRDHFRAVVPQLTPFLGRVEETAPDCTDADRIFSVLRSVQFLGRHAQQLVARVEKLLVGEASCVFDIEVKPV